MNPLKPPVRSYSRKNLAPLNKRDKRPIGAYPNGPDSCQIQIEKIFISGGHVENGDK